MFNDFCYLHGDQSPPTWELPPTNPLEGVQVYDPTHRKLLKRLVYIIEARYASRYGHRHVYEQSSDIPRPAHQESAQDFTSRDNSHDWSNSDYRRAPPQPQYQYHRHSASSYEPQPHAHSQSRPDPYSYSPNEPDANSGRRNEPLYEGRSDNSQSRAQPQPQSYSQPTAEVRPQSQSYSAPQTPSQTQSRASPSQQEDPSSWFSPLAWLSYFVLGPTSPSQNSSTSCQNCGYCPSCFEEARAKRAEELRQELKKTEEEQERLRAVAQKRIEEEARLRAEARRVAEEQARLRAEAQRRAEEERLKAEARRRAEGQERLRAEAQRRAEERRRAEAEERRKQRQYAQESAERERKRQAAAEEQRRRQRSQQYGSSNTTGAGSSRATRSRKQTSQAATTHYSTALKAFNDRKLKPNSPSPRPSAVFSILPWPVLIDPNSLTLADVTEETVTEFLKGMHKDSFSLDARRGLMQSTRNTWHPDMFMNKAEGILSLANSDSMRQVVREKAVMISKIVNAMWDSEFKRVAS